jgi:chitodextrinase
VHPGVVNTTATLNFVKNKIAAGAQPWTAAYNAAAADTYGSLSYVDHPPTDTNGNVDCGSFSSPDIHCHDQRDDATAAYTDALLWYFSGNQAYATLGIKILNDWAGSLVSMTDVNNVVQSGWVGGLYAEAGEIFANTSSGWTSSQITAFKNMLTKVVVPLSQYGQAGQNGNHETQNANAMIQMGVFLDNQSVYNTGVSLWNGRITNYIYMTSDGSAPNSPTNCNSSNWWCVNEGSAAAITTPVGCCKNGGEYNSASSGWCSPASTAFPTGCDPSGYWGMAASAIPNDPKYNGLVQETCRDFEHSTEGVNSLVEGAETARIQGNPGLFTNNAARLSSAMELLAQYLNQAGHNNTAATISGPSWLCGGTLTMLGGSNTSPIPGWEIGYNEFVNREGLAMPNTLALLNANRPMGYDGTRQSAWETLTHAGVGSGSCTATTCSAQGKNCGSISDGCGGTLSCGSCTSPATCGGAGTANVCGTACTPATCSSLGDNCGSVSDGCGGTLNCGSCTAPQYCGGGGTANHCAADTVAPSVPAALNATNVTTTSVTLQWNASTDNVGVTGYTISRSGYSGGTFTSTSTSFTDTGLTAGQAYTYTVSASDAAGNASAQSAALNVTTAAPDTTAPSVPTGLAANTVTSTSITLGWTASTDPDSPVSGYNVFRNGTKVGVSGTNSYVDTGLTASTSYSYTVSAYDPAGNTSAQTSALNATTSSASSNIASTGTGYTWQSMTASSANTGKLAAPAVNDNNTSTEVNIDSSSGDSVNAWEAGGVTFSATHTVTSVQFINGNAQPASTTDGWFTSAASVKLQFSTDGTTWTDSGWTISPAYPATSAAWNQTYTFSGTQQTGIKGVRVIGQVRTTDTSWWWSVNEVEVIGN